MGTQKSVEAFIAAQPAGRRDVFADLHAVILKEDPKAVAGVELMMGAEMIVYKVDGLMKYALAGTKKHMSLHVLPIYGSPALHAKYKALLPKAAFQKGCVNFQGDGDMPLNVVKRLIADSSAIDLQKIREEYLRAKKLAARKKR